MKLKALSVWLLVLLPLASAAQEAKPAKPVITFPAVPSAVSPAPQPSPGIPRLTGEALYVVTSDAEALLVASPLGLVSVTQEAGPLRVRGKFLDGDGKYETRAYTAKTVWIVTAAGKGKVELLAWAVGATKESEIVRKTVEVDAGQGPQPPPRPDEPPVPEPPTPGPAPINAPGLRVLIVYESGDATKMPPAQQSILYGKQFRDLLNAKCVKGPDGVTREWRIYDVDVSTVGESKIWQDAMKRPRTALPWLLVSNPAKGGGFEGPLPANTAEAAAIVNKYAD